MARPNEDLGDLTALRVKLLEENPDYCTLVDVARMLGLSRSAVQRYHNEHLETKTEQGIRLYKRDSVRRYAAKRKRMTPSVIAVKGIDVERLRKVCEVYYRTQYDIAPRHLLKLAKRIAQL